MSSIADRLFKMALAKYAEPFIGMIRTSNVEGGRALLQQIESDYPSATQAVRTVFNGTPKEIVETVSAWWPGVRELPNAEAYAALLQRRVLAEWTKPRPGILPPRRSR